MGMLLMWVALCCACLWLPHALASYAVWALAIAGALTATARLGVRQKLTETFAAWQRTNNERLALLEQKDELSYRYVLLLKFAQAFVNRARIDEVLSRHAEEYESACKNQLAFYQNLHGFKELDSDIELALQRVGQCFQGVRMDEERWKAVVREHKEKFWRTHDLVLTLIEAGILPDRYAVREGTSYRKYLPEAEGEIVTDPIGRPASMSVMPDDELLSDR